VAVFRVDLNYNVKPFVTDLMNATGLAFDHEGTLYVSSRHEGAVYLMFSPQSSHPSPPIIWRSVRTGICT
jgi:hypothetical protein